jgi:hypothetical protein
LDYVQERDHLLNLAGEEGAVIGVSFASQIEAARGNIVALARGGEPLNERFNHQVEEEGR